jgi:hypothetical protein
VTGPDRAGLTAEQAWAGEDLGDEAAKPAQADDVVDYDFDEAWEHQRAQRAPGPKIRLKGTVYELPQSMPAKLILFATNAKRQGRTAADQVRPEETRELLGSILGMDNIDKILSAGVDMEQLGDVLGRCMALYKRRMDAAGNPLAPTPTGAPPTTS